MADNFDAKASLDVTLSGLREAMTELKNYQHGIGDLSVAEDKLVASHKQLESIQSKLAGSFKEIRKASADAQSGLGVDAKVSKQWQDLAQKIRDTDAAHRALSKNAAAAGAPAPDYRQAMGQTGLTDSDISRYRQGQAASLLGSSPAQASNQRAVTALREYDRQINEGTPALRARDTALAQMLRSEQAVAQAHQDELARLPRLRYALYDVATTAGITSTAITTLGVASVAAFASMESSFTGVERTLDGVSAVGVERLRNELIGLTREIPLTFANIAQIATLGNQLGIASGDIAQFTQTTAKFSAVTGMTAEASAQAFGSLGELLNINAGEYEQLGSSIALVGRRSVATEQEIVAMTQRLSASADRAGFTAQQVVALAGAFASLRIAPERAQGVMEKYFNVLNTAISEGGPRLQAFAQVAGVTVDQVEQLVRTDPVGFFERLAVGLGQMDNIAQTGALKQLGLDGLRAGEVFGRVSSNVEVFNKALVDANKGWSDGTELGSQYAKVVDDLASRWQIFLNAVQEAGGAVGKVLAPAIGVALDLLTKMLQALSDVAKTPAGAIFIGLAGIVATLVAAVAGLVAVLALGAASFLAIQTAMGTYRAMALESAAANATLSGSMTGVATTTGVAAGAMRVFKLALLGTGIGAAVVLLTTLIEAFGRTGQSAQDMFDKLIGSGAGLDEALSKDTAARAKALADGNQALVDSYIKISPATKESTAALDENAQAIANAATILGQAPPAYSAANDAIQTNTQYLGENTRAWVRNQLMQSDSFRDLAKNQDFTKYWTTIGADINQAIDAASKSGEQGVVDYFARLEAKARAEGKQFESAIGSVAGQTRKTLQGGFFGNGPDNFSNDNLIFGNVQGRSLNEIAGALTGLQGQLLLTATNGDAAGDSIKKVGADADSATPSLDDTASSMFALEQASLSLQGSIFDLGDSLGQNAGMWDAFSEGGRANLGALYTLLDAIAKQTPNDTGAIAANFQALYDTLVQGGYATAQQLDFLHQKVQSLGGDQIPFLAARSTMDFSNLFNGISAGAQKAAEKVKKVREEVRTLADYASDLSSVMKRSFEIRFGPQQAFDDIASGWNKIAQANEDSRKAIADYQSAIQDTKDTVASLMQELRQLGADKATKQYWLSIATLYGDQLRAAQLREEIGGIDSNAADKQKQIADQQKKAADAAQSIAAEQEKLSRALNGTSDAAIANRASLLSLVSGYSSYLSALASSGASQEELQATAARLRAEFISQATQMGFSRDEVEQYAASFQDMSTVIANIPPANVTANTDPALQALAEYDAKARSLADNVYDGGTISAPQVDIAGQNRSQAQSLLQMRDYLSTQLNSLYRILGGNSNTQTGRLERAIQELDNKIHSMGFADGGYTGNGGVGSVAGAVHGQEFVFSAPATRTLGVNNLSLLHDAAKSGKAFMPSGYGGGLSDLSAATIDNLARRIAYYSKDPGITAQAVQRAVLASNAASASQGRS